MYDLSLNVLKSLHEDHVATLAVLERVETTLGRLGPNKVPAADDPVVRPLLSDLTAVMRSEMTAHFGFEEEYMFPRFMEHADAGIPMMLKGEHDTLRPLAQKLDEVAGKAKLEGFTSETWNQFYKLALELVEREVFHIQKEEMGFLPALDQFLDPAEDGTLSMAYAEAKAKG